MIGASGGGEYQQVAVGRQVPAGHGGQRGRAGGGGVKAAAADGGVQGDDVLGVDEPGGAGVRDDLAGPARLAGRGGDDGEQAAGPQRPLAGGIQHAGIGSGSPSPPSGGGQPGVAQAAVRARAARPRQWPGLAARPRAHRPAPATASSALVPAPGMTTRSPGAENAVMIIAAAGVVRRRGHGAWAGLAGQVAGAGTPGQMLSGTPARTPALYARGGTAPGGGEGGTGESAMGGDRPAAAAFR